MPDALATTVAPAPVVAAPATEPAKVEEGKAPPAAAETPKPEAKEPPKLDPVMAGRLAALERKHAAVQQLQREADQKLATLKDREAWAQAFKADPLKALREAGHDPDVVLAEFLGRQIPPSKDEELEQLRQRDAERQKADAEAKKKAADEAAAQAEQEARSKQTAQALSAAKEVIGALKGEDGDILQALVADGTKLYGVDRLGQDVELSPESYLYAAAEEEWREAGQPKLSEGQLKKLLAHVASRLNKSLASANDGELAKKYRKAPEPVRVPETSVTELGRGEKTPLRAPKSRAELNRLFKR